MRATASPGVVDTDQHRIAVDTELGPQAALDPLPRVRRAPGRRPAQVTQAPIDLSVVFVGSAYHHVVDVEAAPGITSGSTETSGGRVRGCHVRKR